MSNRKAAGLFGGAAAGDGRAPAGRLPRQANVGRYARSVETGWVGKVIAVDGECYKMVGVDMLCVMVGGGTAEENLSWDDVRWFVPEDVRFVGGRGK